MSRVEYWNDAHAPAPNSLVPACGALAVDDRGRVLLQRRRDTGQSALPIGRMELGETPSQCAVRETREETGVLVRVTGAVWPRLTWGNWKSTRPSGSSSTITSMPA